VKIPQEAGGGKTMSTMHAVRILSVSIGCPSDKVYEFVANPENLPKWANGLGRSVKKTDRGWLVETPQGPVTVRFAERNNFGVLDHYVTVVPGVEVYVPLRVIANGSGSEVIFTLFRLPEMTEEKFAEDQKLVEQDLRTLKNLLEKRSACL
jgi:polyketide cyclase/dehydrase/lipid transport protein